MALRFACPNCRAALSAPEQAAGRTSRCRNCHASVTVPIPTIDVEPVRASPPVNVLHVHRDGEVEPSRGHGPGAVAALAWVVVLGASVIVCSGIGLAAWQVFQVPAADSVFGPYRLAAVFLFATASLIPGYVGARALDRLTQ